jgi:hypothetical protein
MARLLLEVTARVSVRSRPLTLTTSLDRAQDSLSHEDSRGEREFFAWIFVQINRKISDVA